MFSRSSFSRIGCRQIVRELKISIRLFRDIHFDLLFGVWSLLYSDYKINLGFIEIAMISMVILIHFFFFFVINFWQFPQSPKYFST